MARNLLFRCYSPLKKLLPSSTLKTTRDFLERWTDFPWRRTYYGQFGEDAMLQNMLLGAGTKTAFERIASRRSGFYVDVGAFAPKQFSNTYSFYQRGWRGINIDATPGSSALFKKVRPRDISIEAL